MSVRLNAAASPDPTEPDLRPADVSPTVHRRSRPRRKALLAMRFDPDLLEWFRSPGRGYQTRMNAALRAYMEHARGDRG